jgi:hypothetical protein
MKILNQFKKSFQSSRVTSNAKNFNYNYNNIIEDINNECYVNESGINNNIYTDETLILLNNDLDENSGNVNSNYNFRFNKKNSYIKTCDFDKYQIEIKYNNYIFRLIDSPNIKECPSTKSENFSNANFVDIGIDHIKKTYNSYENLLSNFEEENDEKSYIESSRTDLITENNNNNDNDNNNFHKKSNKSGSINFSQKKNKSSMEDFDKENEDEKIHLALVCIDSLSTENIEAIKQFGNITNVIPVFTKIVRVH